MGVKGLFTYINKNCIKNDNGIVRPISYFEGKTIIVDVSNYMYKFKSCNGTLIELFDNLIKYLINSNLKIILVFDGITPTTNEKSDEIKVRKLQKQLNIETISQMDDELYEIEKKIESCDETYDVVELIQLKKKLINKREILEKTISHVSQTERRDLYNFIYDKYGTSLEVIHETTEEADKMISRIARRASGKIIVMSDDTDMFLYGCPIVAMNYDYKKHTVNVYTLKTILYSLNVNLMEFIQVCILVGTDYLSPYHENSLLPKISISQMFCKYFKFKETVRNNEKYANTSNHRTKYGFNKEKYYSNFIDFMCFVYLRYSNSSQEKKNLNDKLWNIFECYYRT
jgi:5'-3' exonuclease